MPEPQLVPLATAGCVQLPAPSQTSAVQGLPSSAHELPGAVSTTMQPPFPLHVEDVSQLVAVQVYAVPVHVPPVHTSLDVQALPSLQAVPSASAGLLHTPVAGSQDPMPWHWSSCVQTIGFDPVQVPFKQVLVCMHALAPLQAVPSVMFGFVHAPVDGLHTPATWHWSSAVQTTGFVPVQTPFSQTSVCVQGLPSLQPVPLLAEGFEHTPVVVLHTPATWH
jgi:hypothetical protein